MAELGLTPEGYNRKRLVDIKTDIEAALKLVFGDDIDLDPESRFGQFVGIMSEGFADDNEKQADVYTSQYPSSASGNSLSDVVTLNGIDRQEAVKSTVTLTLTGVEGTPILAGSEASVTTTGEKFITDVEVTIPGSGNIEVAATAEIFGAVSAGIGKITTIDTPIFGWTAVTNTTAADVGRAEETDATLRDRRTASTGTLSNNLVDALFAQLINIDGVEDAVVISNGTDAVDANGIPAHQFLSVISGGDVTEIADVIWRNTPQGILSHGALTEGIVDAQGFPQDVKYSRPTDIPVYHKIDITVDASFPGTGEADIKQAVTDYGDGNFKVSDDVILSEFYTPINTIPGILTIDLRIGLAPSPAGVANLPIAAEEISRYDISQVEVNIV